MIAPDLMKSIVPEGTKERRVLEYAKNFETKEVVDDHAWNGVRIHSELTRTACKCLFRVPVVNYEVWLRRWVQEVTQYGPVFYPNVSFWVLSSHSSSCGAESRRKSAGVDTRHSMMDEGKIEGID